MNTKNMYKKNTNCVFAKKINNYQLNKYFLIIKIHINDQNRYNLFFKIICPKFVY